SPTGANLVSGSNSAAAALDYTWTMTSNPSSLFQMNQYGSQDSKITISTADGKDQVDVLAAYQNAGGNLNIGFSLSNGIDTHAFTVKIELPYQSLNFDITENYGMQEQVVTDYLVAEFEASSGIMPYTYSLCGDVSFHQYFYIDDQEVLTSSTPLDYADTQSGIVPLCVQVTDGTGATATDTVNVNVTQIPDTYSWHTGSWGGCSSSSCSGNYTVPGIQLDLQGRRTTWTAVAASRSDFDNARTQREVFVPSALGRHLLHEGSLQSFRTGENGPAFAVVCRETANNSQNSTCFWFRFDNCEFQGSHWSCRDGSMLNAAFQDPTQESCTSLSDSACQSTTGCTFNSGQQSRTVQCRNQDNVIVSSSNCSGSRPSSTRNC
ncbi:MAG: hypothetical protein ACPGWM_09785, partial [Flavobacteriales bacterium]